jgi:hypothetical protein
MNICIAIIGAASALVYMWRRRWIEALLVLAAAGALAAVAANFPLPGKAARALAVDADTGAATVAGAASLTLAGDGLFAAQWHDLPARPLQWTAPAAEVLRLEFPRRLTLGRMFTLTVRRGRAAPARLQLLAENGQVIAESGGAAADISVQWLPPVAETLLLRARLLDAAGKVVAQGPIPVAVAEAPPLQVQGRFAAPSFDARALNDLLAASDALLDWQVTLGKTVTRSEAPRAAMPDPNLVVVDAAWFERLHPSARAALLAQVAQGTPLIILAASAGDTALWSRTVGLELKAQPENRNVGAPLAMAAAPFNPVADSSGAWSGSGDLLWTRQWSHGRIVWLGVADWHRYAVSEPRALALWWQAVLDRAGVRRVDDVVWQAPEEMPLPGQRLEVCAQGVRGDVLVPALGQSIAWQRRSDKADSSCVALWPQQAGWLTMQARGAKPQAGEVYVFAKDDWPLWQRAQRRDATAHYAARTPAAIAPSAAPSPAWPFAAILALALLGLWWRERR